MATDSCLAVLVSVRLGSPPLEELGEGVNSSFVPLDIHISFFGHASSSSTTYVVVLCKHGRD